MDVGEDEEIAQILVNMRVGDLGPAMSRLEQSDPKPTQNLRDGPQPPQSGKRYGTRTAAGLKVGRSYADYAD